MSESHLREGTVTSDGKSVSIALGRDVKESLARKRSLLQSKSIPQSGGNDRVLFLR